MQGLGYSNNNNGHHDDDVDYEPHINNRQINKPSYQQKQQQQQHLTRNKEGGRDDGDDDEAEQLYDSEYIGDLFDESTNYNFANTAVNSSTPLPNLRSMAQQNALKMMKNMGWDKGVGLGAQNQGRTTHIEVSQMSGRSGLGTKTNIDSETAKAASHVPTISKQPLPPNFKIQKHEADTRMYPHQQRANWVSCRNPIVDTASLYKMFSKDDFDDSYSRFCDRKLLQRVMDMKSEFDNVDEKVFCAARSRSNPYELIGKSIFQNRAAVKMADLDKIASVTNIEILPEENGVIYFADICAGPGGFTEYMYWRFKTERAKGWGFTLRGKNDFNLKSFNKEAPHDNFETCYGVDDTGDITHNENMKSLSDAIDRGTNGRGVALLLADGGFSVQGNYNNQETLTKQIVLCQFLTSLLVLRKGGTFVCKAFDVYTNFSASLLYMLYQSFEHFSIVKPFTSRPANSERYIVCKGLRARKPAIVNFLFEVNARLANKKDVASIIHPDIIAKDSAFVTYFTKSNDDIMREQLHALQSIKKYIEDDYMTIKPLQLQLQDKCLEEWNLPKKPSTRDPNSSGRGGRRGRGGGSYRGSQTSYRQPTQPSQQQPYYPPEQHTSTWETDSHAPAPAYDPTRPDRRAPVSSYAPAASSHHYDDTYNPPYDSHYSSYGSHNSYYAPDNYYSRDHSSYAPESRYQSSSSGGWEEEEESGTGGEWEDEKPAKRQRRE